MLSVIAVDHDYRLANSLTVGIMINSISAVVNSVCISWGHFVLAQSSIHSLLTHNCYCSLLQFFLRVRRQQPISVACICGFPQDYEQVLHCSYYQTSPQSSVSIPEKIKICPFNPPSPPPPPSNIYIITVMYYRSLSTLLITYVCL